jgi:hypothetical protein
LFQFFVPNSMVIVEKWVPNTVPFQTIWEYFGAGHLVVDNQILQGLVEYHLRSGKMLLVNDPALS